MAGRGRVGGRYQCWWWGRMVIFVVMGLLLAAMPLRAQPVRAATVDWPTYLGSNARTNYNANESVITPATAANLKLQWQVRTQFASEANAYGPISTQPIGANGLIYWGGWDGYEYATNPSTPHTPVWATFLGRTNAPNCAPQYAGVASTGTVQQNVMINGVPHSVLFVGGGGNTNADGTANPNGQTTFYALDATNGAILWQAPLGLISQGYFSWSSPAYYNGSVYVGVASFGDCPLVPGKLLKLDAATGTVQATFNTVPNNCVGGGVWGSPAIDESAGTVYIATGNADDCPLGSQNYSENVLELRASDLSVAHRGNRPEVWSIPTSTRIPDGDFGSAIILFYAKLHGRALPVAGVQDKNGQYYMFQRDALDNGPVWERAMGAGGNCPECGAGGIAPGAYDGTNLYVGTGQPPSSATSCQGTLQALRPQNGSTIWQICLPGAVLGAVTAAPGIVVVDTYTYGGTGNVMEVVNSATGAVLYTSLSNFYAAPAIINGVLYVGDLSGYLSAFAP